MRKSSDLRTTTSGKPDPTGQRGMQVTTHHAKEQWTRRPAGHPGSRRRSSSSKRWTAFLMRLEILLLLFGMFSVELLAEPREDIRGEITVNDWSRYGRLEIRLERTRFGANEPIEVRFRVENTGYRIMRLYPSPDVWRTFQVMVLDKSGREIKERPDVESIERKKRGQRGVITLTGENVKEIMLHPGEVFEKKLHLGDYFALQPGQEYRLVGYLYPDARYDFFVRSKNSYEIHINEPEQKRYLQMRSANPLVENALKLTPEETVYLFLSAEMKENWKNYLKYLDLKRYITVYDRFASRFALAGPRQKPVILDEFKRYLTTSPADRLVRFEITDASPERGPDGEIVQDARWEVRARGVRESGGYSVEYEYTYTLEKASETQDDRFWKIVHVRARLLE